MRSSFSLVLIVGMMMAFSAYVVTAITVTSASCPSGGFGYSWDGGTCTNAAGYTPIQLTPGTYSITINTDAIHPLLFTKSTDSPAPISEVTPAQTSSGENSGTVSLTIPASDVGTNIFYFCTVHHFFGTINVIASSTAASSSAGSTPAASSTATTVAVSSTASSVVTSSTGGSSSAFTVTITSDPCANLGGLGGYSWNGGTCTNGNGYTPITLAVGTYTITINTASTHPLLFTPSVTSLATSSKVTPTQSINGQNSGTVTLTVTAADQGTRLYYYCTVHAFYGTLILVGDTSSTSSTGVNAAAAAASPAYAFVALATAALVTLFARQ